MWYENVDAIYNLKITEILLFYSNSFVFRSLAHNNINNIEPEGLSFCERLHKM